MTRSDSDLEGLGWNKGFRDRLDCADQQGVARVAAVDRGQYLLLDQDGPCRGRLAGSFQYTHAEAHQLPCVGDWLCVDREPGSDLAVIRGVIPRRSQLRRRSAGEGIGYQMIAANVDHVMIVQSCHFDFNLKRLERYLVMVRDGGATPHVVLTKTDLVDPLELEGQMAEILSLGIDEPILALSNVTHEGLESLKQQLFPGQTYCFVGSSGVGKSTLINHLIGRDAQATKTVSGTGEGRHTTVRRELVRLPGGAQVIDTPGMREFGVLDAGEGIEASFSDIAKLAETCRYRDCSHLQEPGCAVLAAVRSDEISKAHYESFIKLRAESAYYQMSYAEKRRKDRDFGKLIKSVKDGLKAR